MTAVRRNRGSCTAGADCVSLGLHKGFAVASISYNTALFKAIHIFGDLFS
jgi:hypothetical protein